MDEEFPPPGPLDWLDGLTAMTVRELKSYFYSPLAWVGTTVFMFMQGVLFFGLIAFYSNPGAPPQPGFYHIAQFSMFLMTFLLPALSMHLISAERRQGTLEALLTAPVSETQIVLAKFIGSLLFFLFMIASLAVFVGILAHYDQWESGPIVGSGFGLLLIGGLFLSFGLLASALTESQLVAFLASFLFNLALVYGVNIVMRWTESIDARLYLGVVSIQNHFQDFSRGIVKVAPVTFYLSSIWLCLFLTVRALEARKWR